jgi:SAM-dependent methyltransferase
MPKCRICNAIESDQFIRAPFVFGGRDEHNFWQCKKCNSIYLYPIPTTEEEKKFYLQEFEGFMSTRVGDHRDWSNAEKHKVTNQDQVVRRLPFLEEYLKQGVNLLEIGCSSGFMLDAFKNYGVNCLGVEPSGEFSEFLEKSGHISVNDISDIVDKKFDIITNFFVFEHIRDPFNFIKEMYNLLNDNGVIVCEIPCANDPLTSLYNIDEFEKFYWSIAHHYYYTPESLHYIMDKLEYKYELVPEQRYDLSNHMTWMSDGRPGGQGRYSEALGKDVVNLYKNRLIETWQCDTVFLYIWK